MSVDTVMSRIGVQMRQAICSLHGHDSLVHFEAGRMSLLCSSCGHETPGWDVKSTSARPQGTSRERRVVQMPFAGERHAA